MNERWERSVPVYGFPVLTRPFYAMGVLVAISLIFVGYRTLAGLGPVSGMNDAYGWGIWKTFNVMVLTALGSGAFAVGIAAWVFKRHKLHSLMRMGLLTSFLAYGCALMLLGVDAGRPWNFYWILFPWNWNLHSPLAEVAVCMSVYAMIPLAIENVPPVLERVIYLSPQYRAKAEKVLHFLHSGYPFIVALAYLLPMMHQSSLGALMLLGGTRVHPLWQTPLLPILYVWAAAFMGFACVAGTTMLCCLIWKRSLDMDVLGEAARVTAYLIYGWTAVRFLDIIVRGSIGSAFAPHTFTLIFWAETVLMVMAAQYLMKSARKNDASMMFLGHVLAGVGGIIYRFAPTTLAFRPKPEAIYFPSVPEVIISLGFISVAVMGFLAAVKMLAILPAPTRLWHDMSKYAKTVRPDVELSMHAAAGND